MDWMDILKVVVASSPAWVSLVLINLTKLKRELRKLDLENEKLKHETRKIKNDNEQYEYNKSKRKDTD